MPELKRRIDRYRWQSPTFTDVFSLDSIPTLDDEAARAQRKRFELACAQVNLPLSVVNMRLMPAYTLYDTKLTQVTGQDEIRAAFQRLEAQENWEIGYMMLGGRHMRVLKQSVEHRPLTLQHVITRAAFRRARNQAHFIAGISLQQQILGRNWDQIGHLIIAGDDANKQQFIRSLLLTQMLLHTPTELRIAFIGEGSDEYEQLHQVPHTLGTGTRGIEGDIRLLYGMSREYERRRAIFERLNVNDLDTCNQYLQEDQEAHLPRIVLVLDTLVHGKWLERSEAWYPNLEILAQASARYGIHLILTLRGIQFPAPFDGIAPLISHRFITRTAAIDTPFITALTDFHPSLLRFVDGFFVEDDAITPVETAHIAPDDIQSVIDYWQLARRKRNEIDPDMALLPPAISRATDRYALREETGSAKAPTAQALERAADRLSHLAEEETVVEDNPLPPIYSTPPPPVSDPSQLPRTQLDGIQTTDSTLNRYRRKPETKSKHSKIDVDIVHRAQALATYLGWLGRGPLMDVMALSVEEADTVIAILQARQILERSTNPTPHLKYHRKK